MWYLCQALASCRQLDSLAKHCHFKKILPNFRFFGYACFIQSYWHFPYVTIYTNYIIKFNDNKKNTIQDIGQNGPSYWPPKLSEFRGSNNRACLNWLARKRKLDLRKTSYEIFFDYKLSFILLIMVRG